MRIILSTREKKVWQEKEKGDKKQVNTKKTLILKDLFAESLAIVAADCFSKTSSARTYINSIAKDAKIRTDNRFAENWIWASENTTSGKVKRLIALWEQEYGSEPTISELRDMLANPEAYTD